MSAALVICLAMILGMGHAAPLDNGAVGEEFLALGKLFAADASALTDDQLIRLFRGAGLNVNTIAELQAVVAAKGSYYGSNIASVRGSVSQELRGSVYDRALNSPDSGQHPL